MRARAGSVLVLVPSSGWAERLTARLERRGCPTAGSWRHHRAGWPVVVGNRAGAWAPVPALAAAVILDAHDAAYREESAPTYSAVDVVVKRARREGVPCLLVSPVPPVALAARAGLRTVAPTRLEERAGWPVLERVDRRGADPRSGMFSEEFVRLARSVLDDAAAGQPQPAGLRLQPHRRRPAAGVSSLRRAGPLCSLRRRRGAARGEEVLRCPRCDETRPVVCAACGGLRMKTVRAGVSRLREELAALLGADVGRWPARAARTHRCPSPVLIGTEAVLHRVRRAAAVAFLDIDLHLLAPRLSATEDTLALFVRAARLVGARGAGAPWARMQVQTRVPDHPLLQAVALGEPTAVLAEEVAIRRTSALPPFAALAVVSGALAPAYAESLRREAEAAPDDGLAAVSVHHPVTARRRSVPPSRGHPRLPLRPPGPHCPAGRAGAAGRGRPGRHSEPGRGARPRGPDRDAGAAGKM